MILEIFIYISGILIGGLSFLLPTWTFSDQFANGLSYFIVSAMKINFMFPIFHLLALASTLIVFEIYMFFSGVVLKFIFKDRI